MTLSEIVIDPVPAEVIALKVWPELAVVWVLPALIDPMILFLIFFVPVIPLDIYFYFGKLNLSLIHI